MRWLSLMALVLAAPLAGAYPPPPKPIPAGELPAVTLQALPLGTWLDDIRSLIKVVVPEEERENVLKEFNNSVTNNLDNFEGFDLKKPMGGYVLFGEEPGATALVLVIPYTDEAKFVASISRGKPKATPITGTKGLYKFDAENDPAPFPIRIQFHEGHAYCGINTPESVLTTSLIPASKLINPAEKAHLAAKGKLGKIPASLTNIAKTAVTEFVAGMKKDAARSNPVAEKAAEIFGKFVSRTSDSFFGQTEDLELKTSINPKTADLVNEYIIVPKTDSQMAKDIAARKTTPNRFGAVAQKENVANLLFRVPLFAPELQELAGMGVRELKANAEENAPPLFHPLLAEVAAGLDRNIKAGRMDVGVFVTAPTDAGTYGAALAIGFQDAQKLDEEVQKVVKAIAPKPIQDAISWNVEKADGANIHELDLTKTEKLLPSEVLGKNPKLCLAFGKDMVVVTAGEDARARVKSILASKEAAHSPVFNVDVNPKKFAALLEKAGAPGPRGGLGFSEMFMAMSTIDVTGGDKLTVKQTLNLKIFTMFTAGRAVQGNFQAVPAAPVPVPVKP